jgi:hypothetical protein
MCMLCFLYRHSGRGEVSEVVVKSVVIYSVIVVVGNEEHASNEHFLLLDCLTDLDQS